MNISSDKQVNFPTGILGHGFKGKLKRERDSIFVTYWPSTEPSIKKHVRPVEGVEDVTLTCGGVEFSAHTTPTGSRWPSNNYIIRCHRLFELVGVSCSWSQLQLEFELQFEAVRTSSRLGPSLTPGWATPQNEKGVLLW